MTRPGEGNPNARLMLVGEAWGATEERTGIPFSGASGEELNKQLHQVGLTRSECYVTNIVNARPPNNDLTRWVPIRKMDITPDMDQFRGRWVKPIFKEGFQQLLREIHLVKPNVIVALGNAALWALTGATGITKWRGSQLYTRIERQLYGQGHLGPEDLPWDGKLIPIYHPAYILRDMESRATAIQDWRRVVRFLDVEGRYPNEPQWNFRVRPSLDTALNTLQYLLDELDGGRLEWIDFDLETRAGHIACAGLSWSASDAICIPFMCVEDKTGYWSEAEEAEIIWRLQRVLTHRRVKVRGQNLLYDCQYTHRHWHFTPRVAQDTMIAHHAMWAGLPKSLDFISSMYSNHYVYWKDDGKTWALNVSEDQLWQYNCVDCVRTRESGEGAEASIQKLGMQAVNEFQQKFFWPVLWTMQRGVRIDTKRRAFLADELLTAMSEREAWMHKLLGHPLNPASSKQMKTLFYEDFAQKPIFSRPKKGKPPALTVGKEALQTLWAREPVLRPLIDAVREYRSLRIFLKNFVLAPLDIDNRMRTSYNICGTETYRFASRKNAFGSGTNLQNIPKGDEASEVEDDEEDEDDEEAVETLSSTLHLPNVRKIFIPDDGFVIFDTDLSKADLRIVVWESDEPEMKAMLKEGRDPYIEVAREFYRDPSIRKTRDDGSEDPRYRVFKSFCHGTHYLGTPHGLAGRLGLSVHQAESTQRWYLGKFPKIKAWQKGFVEQLKSRGYVQNVFGYRRYYFGRMDDQTFRKAIAWLPQSTVALYINRIWMNLWENHRHIEVLLQVHDSLVGQFPKARRAECVEQLASAAKIELPYDDPLIIPVGVKFSEKSWGDCE